MTAHVRVTNPQRGMYGAKITGGSSMGDYIIIEILDGPLSKDDVVVISEDPDLGTPIYIKNKTQDEDIEIVIQNFCPKHMVNQQCMLTN